MAVFFTSNRVIIHGITFARNRFKFPLFSDSTDNSTVAYNLLKTGLSESKYEEKDKTNYYICSFPKPCD